ncbi:hypothetical protein BRC93_10175 [Halobacteriales archaeon QS_5_70_15]|nr:MAG: hypothetical protein BRC93_10175 [Halobacteriales archaeon QS_5_70_15]
MADVRPRRGQHRRLAGFAGGVRAGRALADHGRAERQRVARGRRGHGLRRHSPRERALDRETGERRWLSRASFPLFGTPAVEGGTVSVADGGGYLHALAEGGGSGAGSGEGGESPEGTDRPADEFLWQVRGRGGFTASPTVADGIVYATVPRGVVYAFDAAEGAEHWRTGVGHGVTGATRRRGGDRVAGESVYVATEEQEVLAVGQ